MNYYVQSFPSPTVGAFGGEGFNWTQLGANKDEGRNNNFTFHASSNNSIVSPFFLFYMID